MKKEEQLREEQLSDSAMSASDVKMPFRMLHPISDRLGLNPSSASDASFLLMFVLESSE